MDSHVLLHVLSQHLWPSARERLRAVHVNHGLSPAADQWEEHCRRVCAHWRIPFSAVRIEAHRPPGDSVEAWARNRRYQVLASLLRDKEDAVLTAHHCEDQAETVLLQMLRGAGPEGLAAMPKARPLGAGRLIRPLLPFGRRQLRRYADRHELRWVEDDGNADQRLARNYLRHTIMPLLRTYWPGVDTCLARVAGHQSALRSLSREMAEADLRACLATDGSVRIAGWRRLSDQRADSMLRVWLRRQGWPAVPQRLLSEIRTGVVAARVDRNPCLAWRGHELRRYKQRLFSVTPLPSSPASLDWDMGQPLSLPLGVLQARRVRGSGVVATAFPGGRLRLRFRRGGEKLAGSGTLKRYLSDQSVFPWLRNRLPLVYSDGQLIQIPGLWLATGWGTPPGSYGWQIEWRESPSLRP